MSTDEQAERTSGSVPNAYGNALSWKWTRQMSPYLRRSGLPLLLCQLRNYASASGDVAFSSDRKPIRISDIAAASCCSVKDCRRYLEAAIRSGVVAVRGERKRGTAARYVIVPHPFPDWQAAEDYLKSTARKPGRKAPEWSDDEDERRGHRDPNEKGSPRPQLTDGTDSEEGVTATPPSKGHRDPNGWGHRDPNNPGVTHDSSHDGAEVVPQPQVDGAPGHQDPPSQEQPDRSADTASSTGSLTRCRRCDIPLIRPSRDHLCHGCRTHLETRNTA